MIVEGKRIKKVAAIKYDAAEDAPKLIAKGAGAVADKILEKAEENNIPTYHDEKLAETLTKLELGDFIPPELYQVVAEIMVFVTDLDKLYDKVK
ncbi:MAG: flagellar biosynthesis protein FlhB [Firmicutes bacterium HGW-Firmicutes-1]|jgi:flagellar biosynthesis protein|nr:MAG: flagellar biosynthesis protein FlhB [Firmicutes bacterium HGW-Firmicutes-1]